MKKTAIVVMLLACQPGFAQQDAAAEISLPEWEWIVPPTSPALFEREGVILPSELGFWRELWPLLRDGNYEEALEMFRREEFAVVDEMEQGTLHGPLTHGDDISAALLYLLGYTYASLEQTLAAETALRSALQYLPDYVRAHESLGLLYLDEERYDDARLHLSRAAELGLNTASLYGSLGYLNSMTDNPWGAVNAYQQASMLDSENEQWQLGLLQALNQSRNYPSAMALVEQLLKKHPSATDLWVFRAYLAQQTDALASLETAIRLGDDTISNLQVCATLHMQIGSVERATELLKLGFVAGLDYIYIDQALAWMIRQDEWAAAEQLVVGSRSKVPDLTDGLDEVDDDDFTTSYVKEMWKRETKNEANSRGGHCHAQRAHGRRPRRARAGHRPGSEQRRSADGARGAARERWQLRPGRALLSARECVRRVSGRCSDVAGSDRDRSGAIRACIGSVTRAGAAKPTAYRPATQHRDSRESGAVAPGRLNRQLAALRGCPRRIASQCRNVCTGIGTPVLQVATQQRRAIDSLREWHGCCYILTCRWG